ncbi:MAG: hypothetical protein MR503_02415 [Oscillospiraceae bacterium]|nr:hypothetical protein [Oscillospiraceae bacterium]
MVDLNVIPKGNKFIVLDQKERTIYNIKTGMGGKTHLINSGGYKLFYFTCDKKAKKPVFTVYNDDKVMFTAECTSLFLEPGIAIRGERANLDIVSHDRQEFKIMDGENQIGTVTSQEEKKETKYLIEIDEKYFDDYIPLIAVFIDMSFGKINKG